MMALAVRLDLAGTMLVDMMQTGVCNVIVWQVSL